MPHAANVNGHPVAVITDSETIVVKDTGNSNKKKLFNIIRFTFLLFFGMMRMKGFWWWTLNLIYSSILVDMVFFIFVFAFVFELFHIRHLFVMCICDGDCDLSRKKSKCSFQVTCLKGEEKKRILKYIYTYTFDVYTKHYHTNSNKDDILVCVNTKTIQLHWNRIALRTCIRERFKLEKHHYLGIIEKETVRK